jgi:hypothetical protein
MRGVEGGVGFQFLVAVPDDESESFKKKMIQKGVTVNDSTSELEPYASGVFYPSKIVVANSGKYKLE